MESACHLHHSAGPWSLAVGPPCPTQEFKGLMTAALDETTAPFPALLNRTFFFFFNILKLKSKTHTEKTDRVKGAFFKERI